MLGRCSIYLLEVENKKSKRSIFNGLMTENFPQLSETEVLILKTYSESLIR